MIAVVVLSAVQMVAGFWFDASVGDFYGYIAPVIMLAVIAGLVATGRRWAIVFLPLSLYQIGETAYYDAVVPGIPISIFLNPVIFVIQLVVLLAYRSGRPKETTER